MLQSIKTHTHTRPLPNEFKNFTYAENKQTNKMNEILVVIIIIGCHGVTHTHTHTIASPRSQLSPIYLTNRSKLKKKKKQTTEQKTMWDFFSVFSHLSWNNHHLANWKWMKSVFNMNNDDDKDCIRSQCMTTASNNQSIRNVDKQMTVWYVCVCVYTQLPRILSLKKNWLLRQTRFFGFFCIANCCCCCCCWLFALVLFMCLRMNRENILNVKCKIIFEKKSNKKKQEKRERENSHKTVMKYKKIIIKIKISFIVIESNMERMLWWRRGKENEFFIHSFFLVNLLFVVVVVVVRWQQKIRIIIITIEWVNHRNFFPYIVIISDVKTIMKKLHSNWKC